LLANCVLSFASPRSLPLSRAHTLSRAHSLAGIHSAHASNTDYTSHTSSTHTQVERWRKDRGGGRVQPRERGMGEAWERERHGGAWERHGTFFQPMVSAFSRKSRRVIIRPYFLMRPWWEPEHLRTEHHRHHLHSPPPLPAVPRQVFKPRITLTTLSLRARRMPINRIQNKD